jgi:hypothetical protein
VESSDKKKQKKNIARLSLVPQKLRFLLKKKKKNTTFVKIAINYFHNFHFIEREMSGVTSPDQRAIVINRIFKKFYYILEEKKTKEGKILYLFIYFSDGNNTPDG